jgi:hypothetical protein
MKVSFIIHHHLASVRVAGCHITRLLPRRYPRLCRAWKKDGLPLSADAIGQQAAAHRRLFNGLAQVLVQSTGAAGDIVLKATSEGLESGAVAIRARPR